MIIILYPHISCYNNSHIDTHNYSHTHHTHKTVSHISTKHSGYKKLFAQQLNIKQHIATKWHLYVSYNCHSTQPLLPQTIQIDLSLLCTLLRRAECKVQSELSERVFSAKVKQPG